MGRKKNPKEVICYTKLVRFNLNTMLRSRGPLDRRIGQLRERKQTGNAVLMVTQAMKMID